MTPILLVGLGLLAVAAGFLVLRSFGPAFRLGRLLAGSPMVSVAEACRLASAGEPRYVRVRGRIDSDQEFEDADHRPLVFRRTRLETLTGRRWRAFDAHREVVPFAINEGLDTIAIDGEALDAGLVVVRRESVGVARDLADRAPADVSGDAPARLTVEQVSSVEHAIVIGVPEMGPGGLPRLTAGLGRPLVLTTLEPDEAMRILTGGGRARSMLAAGLLIVGVVVAAIGAGWLLLDALGPQVALAASPQPTLAPGSDTRSPGAGPGLVGNPGLALLGVAAIAAVTIVLSLGWVRFTNPRHSPRDVPRGPRGG